MATLYESYEIQDAIVSFWGAGWMAQTFTPSVAHIITSVELYLQRVGSPGTGTVSIRATDGDGKPTGNDLTSGTFNANNISTDLTWVGITFSPSLSLGAETKYAIVVRVPSGTFPTNYLKWGRDITDSSYTRGQAVLSTNSGVTWDAPSDTVDHDFRDWGDPTFIPRIFYF